MNADGIISAFICVHLRFKIATADAMHADVTISAFICVHLRFKIRLFLLHPVAQFCQAKAGLPPFGANFDEKFEIDFAGD